MIPFKSDFGQEVVNNVSIRVESTAAAGQVLKPMFESVIDPKTTAEMRAAQRAHFLASFDQHSEPEDAKLRATMTGDTSAAKARLDLLVSTSAFPAGKAEPLFVESEVHQAVVDFNDSVKVVGGDTIVSYCCDCRT